MNLETAQYIITYFPQCLNEKEKQAQRHSWALIKLGDEPEKKKMFSYYQKKKWLTDDENILALLKEGNDAFEINCATRILNETPDKIFLNKCKKCDQLARTPQARQCRKCKFDWHNIVIAKFQISNSFQITNHDFYLSGTITSGELTVSNYIDLTMLGLNCRPKVTSIESITSNTYNLNLALGTNELSLEEKDYLIQYGSHWAPIDIIKIRD